MPLLERFGHECVRHLRRIVERCGEIRPGTSSARRFHSFGARSLIAFPTATVFGERAIRIGEETLIGRQATLTAGYHPEDPDVPTPALVIGDRCVLGAGVTLTAHAGIVIEDDVWFGQQVFVSDASHGYQDPETPIGRQLGDHRTVRIGAGSWLGHRVIVLPGAQIGRQVVVAAGSVVRGRIPDHCVVAGVPARVVRRLDEAGWRATSDPSDVRPAWTSAEVAAMLRGELDPN